MGGSIFGAMIGMGAGLGGAALSNKQAAKNRKFQKQVLREGVRWRVRDMRAAGLNPILAISQAPGAPPGAMGANQLGASTTGGMAAGSKMDKVDLEREQLRAQTALARQQDRTQAQIQQTELTKQQLNRTLDVESQAKAMTQYSAARLNDAHADNTETTRQLAELGRASAVNSQQLHMDRRYGPMLQLLKEAGPPAAALMGSGARSLKEIYDMVQGLRGPKPTIKTTHRSAGTGWSREVQRTFQGSR